MILVDTSVWIDYFRDSETPQAHRLRAALGEYSPLYTCGLVITEVLQGIRAQAEYNLVSQSLQALFYLPLTRRTYLAAADIYRRARERGRTPRSSIDCLIAACAIENGLPVLHRDRDYDVLASVSELEVVRP